MNFKNVMFFIIIIIIIVIFRRFPLARGQHLKTSLEYLQNIFMMYCSIV